MTEPEAKLEPQGKLYGLLAEFQTGEELVAAARGTRVSGYLEIDAFSPFHLEGLAEAIGMERNSIAHFTLVGGILGFATGLVLQYSSLVLHYPINVGGRPLDSWPLFIPITYELTILFSGIATFIGVFYLSGLPRLHHPLFGVHAFASSSVDRFFLLIKATDQNFDLEQTRKFLESFRPTSVSEVAE